MLSLLKRSQKHGPRVGVTMLDRGVAIAVVQRRPGQRPVIDHCAFYSCEVDEQPEQVARRLASQLGISSAAVFAVAGADDYQLVQVEAPEVQPAELRAAIRWRLRDVINFHIDDAVVDVFQIPDQSRRAHAKMLFAVAARSAAVQRIVSTLAPLARDFDTIDIPELCLRNLSALLPQDQRGLATLLLGPKSAQLILTRQGVLYLARRIDYARGFDISSRDESDGTQIDAQALALELQRSLDYYESHYDQVPIGDLVIAPVGSRSADLADRLRAESSLRIGVLSLSEAMDGADQLPNDLPAECLLALGAALRVETAVL